MSRYRCGVVDCDCGAELLRAIHAALEAAHEWECVRPEGPIVAAPGIAAVIFAVSAASIAEVVPQVAAMRQRRPDCATLVAGTGLAGASILSILRAGAHDVVDLPRVADELVARMRHALGLTAVESALAATALQNQCLRDFVGASPAFTREVAKLPAIAGCDAGVLILGETGTGKEICAQAIHYLSARSSKPWIAVNCGAVPLELIESELFGHVRGAYTSALQSREGLVAEAEGGTLFLDDIDCLPLQAQSKLLRFLQEREYRVVGANGVRRADVRIIAASNRNLGELVARGEFRQDLFFRLNVLTLALPPLRERREDIAALAAHFVGQYARALGRAGARLSPLALRPLLAHDWPGNVRELQHVIERAVLLAAGPVLTAADIDIPGVDPVSGSGDESFRAAKARVVRQFERSYIEHLLASCAGNVTHAANEAKKNRRALFALIRKHHIEPQRFRPGN